MGQRAAEREAVRRAEPARSGRSRPALGVVDRQAAIDRARRHQSRVLLALSGGILASALTAAAAFHAVLAVTQIRADNLRSELATAVARQQNLQLERADLEAPGRVLWLAEHRFKMVAPGQVTYLEPVNPGETVEQAHRPPAGAATHRRRSR
jgi:cell division protein FtsL